MWPFCLQVNVIGQSCYTNVCCLLDGWPICCCWSWISSSAWPCAWGWPSNPDGSWSRRFLKCVSGGIWSSSCFWPDRHRAAPSLSGTMWLLIAAVIKLHLQIELRMTLQFFFYSVNIFTECSNWTQLIQLVLSKEEWKHKIAQTSALWHLTSEPIGHAFISFAQFSAASMSVIADDAQDNASHPSLMAFTNAYWSHEQNEPTPLTNY